MIAQILLRAAGLIEERGWRQGTRKLGVDDAIREICAVEAICRCSTIATRAPAQQALVDHLQLHVRTTPGEAIIRWNDHRATTQTHVVDSLRAAAHAQEIRAG